MPGAPSADMFAWGALVACTAAGTGGLGTFIRGKLTIVTREGAFPARSPE